MWPPILISITLVNDSFHIDLWYVTYLLWVYLCQNVVRMTWTDPDSELSDPCAMVVRIIQFCHLRFRHVLHTSGCSGATQWRHLVLSVV